MQQGIFLPLSPSLFPSTPDKGLWLHRDTPLQSRLNSKQEPLVSTFSVILISKLSKLSHPVVTGDNTVGIIVPNLNLLIVHSCRQRSQEYDWRRIQQRLSQSREVSNSYFSLSPTYNDIDFPTHTVQCSSRIVVKGMFVYCLLYACACLSKVSLRWGCLLQ